MINEDRLVMFAVLIIFRLIRSTQITGKSVIMDFLKLFIIGPQIENNLFFISNRNFILIVLGKTAYSFMMVCTIRLPQYLVNLADFSFSGCKRKLKEHPVFGTLQYLID